MPQAPRLVIEQNPSPTPSSAKAVNTSAAIAGAMKVLHRKVTALEQENSVLRECFQEIQAAKRLKLAVDDQVVGNTEPESLRVVSTRSVNQINETASKGQEDDRKELMQELEQLHQQVNEIRQEQYSSKEQQSAVLDGAKRKYKLKVHKLKQLVKDLRAQLMT